MLQCTVTTSQSKIIFFIFDYVVFVIVAGQNRNWAAAVLLYNGPCFVRITFIFIALLGEIWNAL